MSDYCKEGDFRWKSDDSNVEYNNWAETEPNDWHNNEDCVHLNPNSTWNDLRCLREEYNGYIMTAICQL